MAARAAIGSGGHARALLRHASAQLLQEGVDAPVVPPEHGGELAPLGEQQAHALDRDVEHPPARAARGEPPVEADRGRAALDHALDRHMLAVPAASRDPTADSLNVI